MLGTLRKNNLKPLPVENALYDRNYFLAKCGGADCLRKFVDSSGTEIYPVYKKILSRLSPTPSQRILDVGCRRGEVGVLLALKGLTAVGLDYSAPGLEIAAQIRNEFGERLRGAFHLVQGDASCLPFTYQSFHAIILADIVEHLHRWQLDTLYSECRRLLKPSGRVIIHTWPNLWHTKYTYPVVAALSKLMSINRSKDHRKPHDRVLHVNEQSIRSLREGVRQAGFKIEHSWCEHDCAFSWNPNQFTYWLFHRTPGFRLIFADHLWVLAKKQ